MYVHHLYFVISNPYLRGWVENLPAKTLQDVDEVYISTKF